MTKTQLSVRIAPDTLAIIDAEARRLGVSRGHVVDRWLAESAGAATRDMQQWRKVHELLEQADDYVTEVDNGYAPPTRLVATVLIARCPVCGEKLYQINRGATLQKRGNAWRCPVDIDEVWRDERGRLHRKNDARHAGQVWLDDEVTWKQE